MMTRDERRSLDPRIGAASYAVDFVAAALGAKHLGASNRAMVGAGLGTLLGLFTAAYLV